MKNHLQDLSDPTKFHNPISIDHLSAERLRSMLKSMIIIRKTEQQLAMARKDGLIGGPVHLGAGQEAIAVGISESLQSSDRVFGAHRSHSHLLALNPDFYKLFAEVLGKITGFSKGMDNRKIFDVHRSEDGNLYAATHFGLFAYNIEKAEWEKFQLKVAIKRFVAIESVGDTIYALNRSYLFKGKSNGSKTAFEKIELKKMCGGENKKYRRVGNECRLSCCPFEI